MSFPKVGHIVGFTVIKALPDYDAYLCKLMNYSLLARLPKKYAKKIYKIGEVGWGSIFEAKGPRITLSQKSPQYVRKILEYLLTPVLEENNLQIKHVAWTDGFKYHKVAIAAPDETIPDNKKLYQIIKPSLEEINLKEYLSENVSFVKYSANLKEYVINALCPPGEKSKVLKVIYHEELNKVMVFVEKSVLGIFIGKGGENRIVAAKLCGCEIEIKGINALMFSESSIFSSPTKETP